MINIDKINPFALLRSSKFLDSFGLIMFNSNMKVQIQILNDLQKILDINTKNKEIIVTSGIQDFTIQILFKLCYQCKMQSTPENINYVRMLTNFVQKSLEYGVSENSEAINMLLVANQLKNTVKRHGKKQIVSVSQEFMNSILETLQLKEV